MPSYTDGTSTEEWFKTLDTIFRVMNAARTAWTPGNPASARPDEARTAAPQELMEFAAQASMACLNSGVRYWQRMAELSGSAATTIGRTLMDLQEHPPQSAETQGRLRDALRAYFRELADVPAQEAQRLQAELARLEQAFWAPPAAQDASPYWRRWRVKP